MTTKVSDAQIANYLVWQMTLKSQFESMFESMGNVGGMLAGNMAQSFALNAAGVPEDAVKDLEA